MSAREGGRAAPGAAGAPPGGWTARLLIHPSAFVAPGAIVVGTVTLGARSSVWFNTVVRGDTAPVEVGDDTNLQDNSVVHVDEGQPARIGSRVTVGHRAIVHGCVVEDDCLIGMGSIVLSGARVGAGSLVAAGALVREGQIVPPASLVVGAPARVVGPVLAAHREAIARGAEHYADLARSYVARGFARPHAARAAATGMGVPGGGAPMTFVEWTRLCAVLAEGPGWAAARVAGHDAGTWRRAAGEGRWSALEVLCHLRDADLEVLAPRIERFLAEEHPEFANVDMNGWETARGYREQAPPVVLETWRAARAGIVARLEPLGPAAWARVGMHSLQGPYTLRDMARYFAEHDLSHRRQMAIALGEWA